MDQQLEQHRWFLEMSVQNLTNHIRWWLSQWSSSVQSRGSSSVSGVVGVVDELYVGEWKGSSFSVAQLSFPRSTWVHRRYQDDLSHLVYKQHLSLNIMSSLPFNSLTCTIHNVGRPTTWDVGPPTMWNFLQSLKYSYVFADSASQISHSVLNPSQTKNQNDISNSTQLLKTSWAFLH